jgi:hypothetical protein
MARTAAARTRRSKAEVQADFDKIREEVSDARQSTTAKDDELAKFQKAEVRQAVEAASVESVVLQTSNLSVEISKALSDVSAKLVSEVEHLMQLREAVALESKELERLHKLDVAATALDHLVEEHRLQKEKLDAEIASQRAAWTEEKQAQLRDQKEAEESLKKQRQRENDEYEYKKGLERKKAQDKYEEEIRLQEKKNSEKQEALEKSWLDREATLKGKEDELSRYKQEVEQVPARLKEERERAQTEASAVTRQTFEQQIVLLKKDSEAEKKVADLRIQSLEQVMARQAQQIELLSKQLDEAKRQVQDIALKAIEGASGANALAHVNQIAIEQAKMRMGQG